MPRCGTIFYQPIIIKGDLLPIWSAKRTWMDSCCADISAKCLNSGYRGWRPSFSSLPNYPGRHRPGRGNQDKAQKTEDEYYCNGGHFTTFLPDIRPKAVPLIWTTAASIGFCIIIHLGSGSCWLKGPVYPDRDSYAERLHNESISILSITASFQITVDEPSGPYILKIRDSVSLS